MTDRTKELLSTLTHYVIPGPQSLRVNRIGPIRADAHSDRIICQDKIRSAAVKVLNSDPVFPYLMRLNWSRPRLLDMPSFSSEIQSVMACQPVDALSNADLLIPQKFGTAHGFV